MKDLHSSFPRAFSGNPASFKSLDPRKKRAEVTLRGTFWTPSSARRSRVKPRCSAALARWSNLLQRQRKILDHFTENIDGTETHDLLPAIENKGW